MIWKMKIFKKKNKSFSLNKVFGIIELTESALENGTIDKFNKKIILREGVVVAGEQIIWGRIIDEIPYSEEAVESLEKIREIAVVERQFRKPEFIEEEGF